MTDFRLMPPVFAVTSLSCRFTTVAKHPGGLADVSYTQPLFGGKLIGEEEEVRAVHSSLNLAGHFHESFTEADFLLHLQWPFLL